MDNRRWRYDPHLPPDDQPAGWVVAGEERFKPVPWEDGHARTPWPEPGDPHEPDGWYAGDQYARQRYAAEQYGEQYAGRSANGRHPQWNNPDQYEYAQDQYVPQDPYPDQYAPEPYDPEPGQAHYARDPYPARGRPGDPYGAPAYPPDPYPAGPAQGDPLPGYLPDPTTPPGGWAGGAEPRHTGTGPMPVPRPRRRAAVELPVAEREDEPVPTVPALTWTVSLFLVPLLLYLAWALTRSGLAPAGCVDAAGDPCPDPRAEAVGSLASALPAVGGAVALAVLAAAALRRMATAWRPATVGLAAAVIGAGIATLVAAILG